MMYNSKQPKITLKHIKNILNIEESSIHKKLKTMNIHCPKISNRFYITHNIAKSLFALLFQRKKIAFQIVKGGTGKTTAVHNISCAASLFGARILAIDLDPQGNLTDAFDFNPENCPILIDVLTGSAKIQNTIVKIEEGIDLIPSRVENITLDSKILLTRSPLHNIFYNLFKNIEDNYDYILIDCPPMIGHTVTAASLYSDIILAPLNPDKFSAKGLSILKSEIAILREQYKHSLEYKIFLNKFNANTILSDKTLHTILDYELKNGNALATAVPLIQEIPNTIDKKHNLFSSVKISTARNDFYSITKELLKIQIKKS